jgi:hypothetical protein
MAFATLSDGTKVEAPQPLAKALGICDTGSGCIAAGGATRATGRSRPWGWLACIGASATNNAGTSCTS